MRTTLMILLLGSTLNAWADNIAESQVKAKKRYKDFIAKVKEDAADERLNQLEIDRHKAHRIQNQELKERARREYVAKREIRLKRELTSEMRDRILEEQLNKERQKSAEAAKLFLRQRELIKKALKTGPVIDEHDEFEVGKHYEDDSGEVEEEDDLDGDGE